ncbi:MAG: ABC transporter ATP-binding protein [Lachnospiraceae bacterium]|nr:ABC transporter ATP-binding protein [Lachnospiraceae bacterium]
MSLLEVRDLHTSFFTDAGEVMAVNGVSFDLDRGQTLGIVGESGSGKSVTAYSIMGILAANGKVVSGSVKFDGKELIGCGEAAMRKIRGNRISIIFQEAMTSLNPTMTVGAQIMESIRLHTDATGDDIRKRALELLGQVRINEAEKRLKQYPHELSGGMRQRIMIAMALASDPDILIADEPTTALDVTIQAQILELMKTLQKELGMAIIMITHDLGVIAEMCDEVMVMYAGSVCEKGSLRDIFKRPAHEYTKGLLNSMPSLEKVTSLKPIRGTVPDLLALPKGCAFAERCDETMKVCLKKKCPLIQVGDGHLAACWLNVKEMGGDVSDV